MHSAAIDIDTMVENWLVNVRVHQSMRELIWFNTCREGGMSTQQKHVAT